MDRSCRSAATAFWPRCRSRSGCSSRSSSLPLAAEESVDPKRDMPKGIMAGMFTLLVSAFLVLTLNPSVTGVGVAQARRFRRTASRRLPRPLRNGNRDAACSRRPHGPDRELPHHHLRLRPPDLFAVARRLLPACTLRHARRRARPRTSRSLPVRYSVWQ